MKKRDLSERSNNEKFRKQVEELQKKMTSGLDDSGFQREELNELASLMKDSYSWNFLYRVISEEGPWHKKETNVCFLNIFNLLLRILSQNSGKKIEPYPFELLKPDYSHAHHPPHPHEPGPIHHPHPPHHRADLNIPIGVPSRILSLIFENDPEKLINNLNYLLQGPPHDVFMNVLMLHIFEQFYSHIEGKKDEHLECKSE